MLSHQIETAPPPYRRSRSRPQLPCLEFRKCPVNHPQNSSNPRRPHQLGRPNRCPCPTTFGDSISRIVARPPLIPDLVKPTPGQRLDVISLVHVRPKVDSRKRGHSRGHDLVLSIPALVGPSVTRARTILRQSTQKQFSQKPRVNTHSPRATHAVCQSTHYSKNSEQGAVLWTSAPACFTPGLKIRLNYGSLPTDGQGTLPSGRAGQCCWAREPRPPAARRSH